MIDGLYRTGLAALAPEAQKAWIERDADTLSARVKELEAAIDDYILWEPKRAGYAAARRRLLSTRRRTQKLAPQASPKSEVV